MKNKKHPLSLLCLLCLLWFLPACRTEDPERLDRQAWILEQIAIALDGRLADQLPGDGGPETGAGGQVPGDGGQETGDAASITFLDANVSAWPVTATLKVFFQGGQIVLDSDKANTWPAASLRAKDGSPMNANAWIIADIGGRPLAATWEWMKVGQKDKNKSAVTTNDGHISAREFGSFKPVSGQSYGFMVSTPARGGVRTINERSNIITVVWP